VNREQPEQLINIAYSVSQLPTWEREIAALNEAGERFPKAERILVAHERSSRQSPDGIQIKDAWRYLLTSPETRT
jgi:hypothetical protein